MEANINKLLQIFQDQAQQPFFGLAVKQLAQIHSAHPQTLHRLLPAIAPLMHSRSKDATLRLRHRQIFAALLEMVLRTADRQIRVFLGEEDKQSIQYIFAFSNIGKFERPPHKPTELSTLEQVVGHPQLDYRLIHFERLMATESLGRGYQTQPTPEQEQLLRQEEEEFLSKLKAMQILREQVFFQQLLSETEEKNEAREIKQQKSRRKLKESMARMEQFVKDKQEYCVHSPFRTIVEQAVQCSLSKDWEIRHSGMLVLKSLCKEPFGWLEFQADRLKLDSWQQLRPKLKDLLSKSIPQGNKELGSKAIAISLTILAVDKFVDYQGERCNILIRDLACDILLLALLREGVFVDVEYELPLDIAKWVFKTMLPISQKLDNRGSLGGWELRLSAFCLLAKVLQKGSQINELLFLALKEDIVGSLHRDEVDDIVLHVCQCLLVLLEEYKIQADPKLAVEVLTRVQQALESADDITFATGHLLKIVSAFLAHSDLPYIRKQCLKAAPNILACLVNLTENKVRAVRLQVYNLIGLIAELIPPSPLALSSGWQKTVLEPQYVVERGLVCLSQRLIIQDDKELHQKLTLGIERVRGKVSAKSRRQIYGWLLSLLDSLQQTNQLVNQHFVRFADFQKSSKSETISSLYDVYSERAFRIARVVQFQLCEPDFSGNFRRLIPLLLCKGARLSAQLIKKILAFEETSIALPQASIFVAKIITLVSEIERDQGDRLAGVLSNKQPNNFQKIYLALKSELHPRAAQLMKFIEGYIKVVRGFALDLKVVAAFHYLKYIHPPATKIDILNQLTKPIMNKLHSQRLWNVAGVAGETLALLLDNQRLTNQEAYRKISKNVFVFVGSKYSREKGQMVRASGQVELYSSKYLAFRTLCMRMSQTNPSFFAQNKQLIYGGLGQTGQSSVFSLRILCALLGTAKMNNNLLGVVSHVLQPLKANSVHLEPSLFKKVLLKLLLLQSRSDKNKELIDSIVQTFCQLLEKDYQPAYAVLQQAIQNHRQQLFNHLSKFVLIVVKGLASQNLSIQKACLGSLGNILAGQTLTPSTATVSRRQLQGRRFVEFLNSPQKFQTPAIQLAERQGTQLREYQKQGIKWLSFLTHFGLSGALCDQMGLGKTLQTLAVLNQLHIEKPGRTSLIICPPTLVYHWLSQQKHFFPHSKLRFQVLEDKPGKADCVYVLSYMMATNRVQTLLESKYLAIVLDEGHQIRNPKTKVSKAIKRLAGDHRVLLSGTPIQNNLVQLWSIFQFLLKGYLGEEDNFKKKFHYLFKASIVNFEQDKLLFSEEQRDKLELLHKKTAPFILRRTKAMVLKDIPDKVVQDYECVLTKQQCSLYQAARSDSGENPLATLNRIRLIFAHPSLVQPSQPKKYFYSGKMLALVQIFEGMRWAEDPIGSNKVVVFSQFNKVLKLVESEILNQRYKDVPYLTVSSEQSYEERFRNSERFNNEPQYKVLLIGTKVGAHGLNLSKAGVVVMFDHSYNPCQDEQAMNRAHRIGQKKVLLIYRLITKSTLEEALMNYQRFKVLLANSVINVENSSISNLENADAVLVAALDQFRKEERRLDESSLGPYSKLIEQSRHAFIDENAYRNPFDQ